MNTRAKILNPVIDVVDAGVNLIKGKKKQTLEPVDYSLTAPVTKADDTKPTWDELWQKPAILGEKPNPSSTQLIVPYNQFGKNVLERINLRNNAAANKSNIQFLDRAIELSKTQGYGAVKYDDDVINAWVLLKNNWNCLKIIKLYRDWIEELNNYFLILKLILTIRIFIIQQRLKIMPLC